MLVALSGNEIDVELYWVVFVRKWPIICVGLRKQQNAGHAALAILVMDP